MNIPKSTIYPYELRLKSDKKGIFFIYLSLYNDDKIIDECRTSFAVCAKPVNELSFQSPFGVHASLFIGELDKIVKVLNRLSISWVRSDFGRGYIEKQKGKFSWKELDGVVKKCYDNRVNICSILTGIHISDPTSGSEECIEDFSTFASNVVYRYKDKIKYWEIWNEPDLWCFWPGGPNAANYTKLLKACYIAIKKVDSTSKVLIGGLARGIRNRYWFLSHIYENSGGGYFDFVAIHPYIGGPPEKNNELEYKIIDVANRTDKKICITEIGWPCSKKANLTPKDQANFLVRTYIIVLSYPNVDKIFWHCFRNSGLDAKAHQQNYGLINNDFTPKPAAVAYLNMVNQIGGLRYVGRLDLKDPLRGYVFWNGNRKVKILWSIEGEKILDLPVRSKVVLLTDIMGNTEQIQVRRGKVRLLLTGSPAFLEER